MLLREKLIHSSSRKNMHTICKNENTDSLDSEDYKPDVFIESATTLREYNSYLFA